MSRADYLKNAEVNSSQCKWEETMPPEDRMAVAIWTRNQDAVGTVRLDFYLQKKTDVADDDDSNNQYDFLEKYVLEDVPVGQTYNNSDPSNETSLRYKVDDAIGKLKSYLQANQGITLSEAFSDDNFFKRNRNADSNAELDKAVVPGMYDIEGNNVIKIKYDRAKVRIKFGGSDIGSTYQGKSSGGTAYYLVKHVTTSAHAVNLYAVEFVSTTETCWYRNSSYAYADKPGTGAISTGGNTGSVTIQHNGSSETWTRTGRSCKYNNKTYYEATRNVTTVNATPYQGPVNQNTVGWHKITSETADANGRYAYNASGAYAKFGAKVEEGGVTYVIPLYVQSGSGYAEPSETLYEWGTDGQFWAKDEVEWKFETANDAGSLPKYHVIEGLYQGPLKTPDGESFAWPQKNVRFTSYGNYLLTFQTYFAPAKTENGRTGDSKWNSDDNCFDYNMYNGQANTATNKLNFYTEALGRLSTDDEPTYDSEKNKTVEAMDAKYAPPGIPPSVMVTLNGSFTLSDKFDGFNVFAYRTGATTGLLNAKNNSAFVGGISFSDGGKIYAKRLTYSIRYDNANDMLTAQPSNTDKDAEVNYYNYPLKRLYGEELEQLPKLTNYNYPEGDADYTFAGWSTVLDFYDKESYVTDGDGKFVKYEKGQLVRDTSKHTMPSNGLTYIAMWSSPKNVQLMAPVAGTANSKNTQWEPLTTSAPITVEKYTALTGNHNGYKFAKDSSVTKQVYDGRGREVIENNEKKTESV